MAEITKNKGYKEKWSERNQICDCSYKNEDLGQARRILSCVAASAKVLEPK